MLYAIVGLLDNSTHIDSYVAYTMNICIYNHEEWLGWVLKLQAIMLSARKGFSHIRLGSLCKYTAEDLEFLDTPVHIHVVTMHKYKTEDCNDDLYTHCKCTTNYSFIHVNLYECCSCEIFQLVAGLVNF